MVLRRSGRVQERKTYPNPPTLIQRLGETRDDLEGWRHIELGSLFGGFVLLTLSNCSPRVLAEPEFGYWASLALLTGDGYLLKRRSRIMAQIDAITGALKNSQYRLLVTQAEDAQWSSQALKKLG